MEMFIASVQVGHATLNISWPAIRPTQTFAKALLSQ